MSTAMQKYAALRDRLRQKIKMSATPVKGFILGLSGTDSILTFMLLSEIGDTEGFTVYGVHYARDAKGVFPREGHGWLREHYPEQEVWFASNLPDGFDQHQHIIADLHVRAVANPNERLWVASTMNATEKYLGTYSILEKAASIAPIASLYKSEVLDICAVSGVPQALIDASQIPDCACGRDEWAAANIDLIDDIIRVRWREGWTHEQLRRGMEYINQMRRDNDFKNRTPYTV